MLKFSLQNSLQSFESLFLMVLGKNPPGKPPTDPKPNPIPNITLTLPLTPYGGLFSGRCLPDTETNTSRKAMEWLICFSIVNLMLGCLLI